jgi:hypothetical protein
MLSFYRKIRQDLIAKNKVTRYLKYAVGEILLVVIGILIALSINNKNTEISKRNAELNFYQNTKQQLLDDAINIKSIAVDNSKFNKQFNYAISIIELNDRSKKDSLGKIAIDLIHYSDFDRQGNIYETMVNSGDIQLLKNDEIIEKLKRLEETYIYLNRMETIHFDAIMSIIPSMSQTLRFSSKKVENEDKLYAYDFQNNFVLALRIIEEKGNVYNRALREIEVIVKLIDKELE